MDELDFLSLPRINESPLAARWKLPLRPTIVAAAPILLEGREFQLHPDPSGAPACAWRPLVAIRLGTPSWSDMRCAIAGDILDFAALSPAADRVIATLHGLADVLGGPPDELFASARGIAQIHLRRTPAAWLSDLNGAVLVRPLTDSASFLRQFTTVIADDIGHAEAIDRALRRAYRGPNIRVAASRRLAA